MEQVIQAIEALLGPQGCLIDQDARRPYESGARYGNGSAACIARPANVEEAAELLRLCARDKIRIVAQGANTGLVGAASPDRSGRDVVLSMERIKGIVEIDPVDRVVQAYAGTRLSDLNQALAPHGLCFPIDLGADPSLGGMLAANTGGARLIRYGDVRHNVLGLEALLMNPPGQRLDLTNRLRKNNTGPDWKQWFIGTGGAYGIVTQAVLQVHPLPQQCATALVVPASPEAGLLLLRDAERHFSDFLTAFEGISHNAMQSVLRHLPGMQAPFEPLPPYAFLIELSSARPRSADFDLEKLFGAWLEACFGDLILDAVIDKPEVLWRLRHAISESVRHEGKVIAFDIAVPRSRLAAFREEAVALVGRGYPGVGVFDFGHWGDGGLHFNLVVPQALMEVCSEERIAVLRQEIYDLAVRKYRGSFSAEHGVGPFNQSFYDRYTAPEQQALAAGMQAAFDPERLLGATRFMSAQ
ncbi:FAD-binding oxidoreductase [Paraherbaspirillum soli]|uniref:FAD-binding oxidoreductase n=1 Tax=Paraherbaspirillum soli TaxID=631222 RepID=A0ABW0MBQ9_9BURK